MKQPYIYIIIGAVVVLLLWQFTRVRTDNIQLRQQLRSCSDSLNAVKRDTIRDTTWHYQEIKEYIYAQVPVPVMVTDTVYLTPPLTRYEDSVALDTNLTLYYRLNVRGTLVSQGYRYQATLPHTHSKEIIYLPGEADPVSPWHMAAGPVYSFDQHLGFMTQIGYKRVLVGYGYAGRHQVSLLYKL